MEALYGKTLNELKNITGKYGLPGFTAKQIADWLYKKDVESIDKMTNLSKKARAVLKENFTIGLSPHHSFQESADGTKKYLFRVSGGRYIESAYIPDKDRATLCVSSQVGCKMDCAFCMTGKQGFHGQLSSGEILNQIRSLPEYKKLTNVVYMGMGEPLDNIDEVLKSIEILTSDYGYGWSPKRITVSTIGIIPALKKFIETSKAHLAISMHTPFNEERLGLMPVEKVYPIEKVLEVIKSYDFGRQRRISFEYIMFKGLNDTPAHIKGITKLLQGLRCRVNLIRFHAIPGFPHESPSDKTMIRFRDSLSAKGITTTIRLSRGEDIYAACGMLSTDKQHS
ncbi:MAG: 23S rRNA (adenine(2503)-C(2))-methyltransferase RlmN [Chlorobi bacterium]|nr:23S rRNA (adenine(2503)-C(2))-methyltransferase RlmN [Chlorobiota bacterium]